MNLRESRNKAYNPRRRAKRKVEGLRRFLYSLAVWPAAALIRLIFALTRVVAVTGEARLPAALAAHGSVIPVYWHQHQLVPVRHLMKQGKLGLRLGFLVSPSIDGEIPSMMLQRAGAHVIRGSSTVGGTQALRDYYQAIKARGVSPAITPDGPHGPRREFKPGAVLLSQLSGKPMLPMAFAARRAILFRTWDRFVLPLPFSACVLAIGEPRLVPQRLAAGELERWQGEMKSELDRLYLEAQKRLHDG